MDRQTDLIWNPYTVGYFQNPYEHLKVCRQRNPIHQVKTLDNSWFFFKYNDINDILSSNKFEVSELSEFFKEKEPYIFKNSGACPFLAAGTKMWPMYLNKEIHKQTRAVMSKGLNLKGLDKAMAGFVEIINHQHHHKKEFDLVTYCAEYVFLVVKQILGLRDFGEFDKIRTYSNMLAKSQDLFVPKQIYLEINSCLLWGKEIFRGSEFKNSMSAYEDQSGVVYSEDDAYSMSALALMAAFETSKDNLSVALHAILQEPDLIDYILKCSPRELDVLIEELFRFSSPLQYTVRVNTQALEYNDIFIPERSKLFLCLASANRDESVFENPDQIQIARTSNEHLSFGKGVHFCLGANIARMELRHCLKPMVEFLKEYKLNNVDEVQWSKQIFMRTVESVLLESRNT